MTGIHPPATLNNSVFEEVPNLAASCVTERS